MDHHVESATDRKALSPLIAGIALAALSAAVAVASIFFIADPRVGVFAAIVLSFGCVGAAAGLVLARRKSWSDATWPPDTPARAWSVRRIRRVLLVYGVFLVAMALAVGVATAIGGEPGEPDDVGQGWVLVVLLAVAGVVSIVLGLRRTPEAVQSSERPTGSTDEGEEWVRLGPARPRGLFSWWAGLVFTGQPFLVIGAVGALFPLLSLRLGAWTWTLAATGVLGAALIAGIVLRRRSRAPSLSRDATRFLVGEREFPVADIMSAMVMVSRWEPDATARSLAIVFSARDRARAVVELRDRGHLALTEDETALLMAAVERSRIDLPRDEEDPRGRFSRALYPNYLTKEEAAQMVERPPGDGDPLPVSPPTA